MPSTDTNPIIPGFAPDPSVVLIDGTFFLVNSTFHLFPGLPIYASKDLLSWEHIGNAINRQEQLSLANSGTKICLPDVSQGVTGDRMLATGGLYAPTIRHRDGVTYVICTNVLQPLPGPKQNFIVSTTDIWSDQWSQSIFFDFDGIDPSIFFDEDGRVYMQGSGGRGPMTKINLFEIDLKTGKKLSEEKTIWEGTGGIYPEGPHIYKKDGLYYLMISEGGTHENHMITVAKSKDIWGPYDAFEKNPILTARDTDEYIRYTGHCDMFQDQEGRWWGVCLGSRKNKTTGTYIMGRETFLTTGTWEEGKWPTLKQVKLNPVLEDGTAITRAEGAARLTSKPLVDYLYIRDAVLSHHHISDDAKTISLTPSKADLSQWEGPVTFIGKRQREHEGRSEVAMKILSPPADSQLKSGLAYYKDEHRFIKLLYDYDACSIVVETVNKAKDISKTSKVDLKLKENDSVSFLIEYTETKYTFSYRVGGDEKVAWTSITSIEALDMNGPDFVGPVVGIFATSKGPDVRVEFHDLVVE
ncbi:related to xylosidase/arabinosidase [Rhynchosporium secalis]|uniref:Related to xylosidase/arabinosidase n=1 Tax=Rhynchosporium secalis TaxID=38038 RepID=A0A1E1MQJ6_RHYSE|nr:related to xylosidase/arabinosidase [Rhynchosporium secalis]